MPWTVRTLQLPTVTLHRTDHESEEAAWMAYLAAIENAKQRVADSEDDLAVGVDLQHHDKLIEQHWITLSSGVQQSGKT